MAGEKRFRNSFIGFNKSDVSAYMENIIKEYSEQLRQRDEEITSLKSRNTNLEGKCTELEKDVKAQLDEKNMIANAIISAQQKAAEIMKSAEEQAEQEKKRLELELEDEREKIVEAKSELKRLKKQAIDTMKLFSVKIDGIVEEVSEEVV
jgi:Uncharacterized conserved protein